MRIKDVENGCYLVLDGILMLSRTKEHHDGQIFYRIYRQVATTYTGRTSR